VAGNLNPVGRG